MDGARVEPLEASTVGVPSTIDAVEALTSCEGLGSGAGISFVDGARVEPLEVSTVGVPSAIDAGEALTSCDGLGSGAGISFVDGALEPLEVSIAVVLASLSVVGFRAGAAKVFSVSIPEDGRTGVEEDMLSAVLALGDFV